MGARDAFAAQPTAEQQLQAADVLSRVAKSSASDSGVRGKRRPLIVASVGMPNPAGFIKIIAARLAARTSN